MKKQIYPMALCALISACSSSKAPQTAGQSGVLGSSGSSKSAISAPFVSGVSGKYAPLTGELAIADGGGAQYSITMDRTDGPVVAASLMPGTNALTPPKGGSATMTGKFGLLKIEDAKITDGVWSGTRTAVDGDITLKARFGAGTLTGGGDGLSVDGKIAPDGLSGLVSYDGVEADLDGIIGEKSTVGIFYGGHAGRGIAGGFAAAAP